MPNSSFADAESNYIRLLILANSFSGIFCKLYYHWFLDIMLNVKVAFEIKLPELYVQVLHEQW